MNIKLIKALSFYLAAVFTAFLLPSAAFAAEEVSLVTYTEIAGDDGRINSGIIIQEHETETGKSLGVYRGNGTYVDTAEQGAAAPNGESGVRFTLTKGLANAYLLFASRDVTDSSAAINIPNEADEAYIEFDIYAAAQFPARIQLQSLMTDGQTKSMVHNLSSETGKWVTVKLPLSAFTVSKGYTWRDTAAVDQLKIYMPNTVSADSEVYIKNMRIAETKLITSASIISTGIDAEEHSFVKLEFSKAMKGSSVTPDKFSIDGFSCTTVEQIDEKTFKLIFEEPFVCPSDYVLNVGKGLIDAEGEEAISCELPFTTTLRLPTEPSIKGFGVAGENRTYINVGFSRNIATDTVRSDMFTMDGFVCTEAEILNGNTVRLLFDGAMKYPGEYILCIAQGITDEDGYVLKYAEIPFTAEGGSDIDTVAYNTLIGANGWIDSKRLYNPWDIGSGKALGVANKIGTGAEPLQRAVQGAADPETGAENSVLFPVKAGNSNAFLLFASRSHVDENQSVRVPNESEMAYMEFEIYSTGIMPERLYLDIKTTDAQWPKFTYNLNGYESGKWHQFKIPFSAFSSNNARYTWKDAVAIDSIEFILPSSVSEDADIYIKNFKVTSLRPKTSAAVSDSGMGNDGNANVFVRFDRNIDNDSVTPDLFYLDGYTCIDVEKEESNCVKLVFDGQFKFPKSYTIYVSGGMKDSEGYSVSCEKLSFTTRDYSDDIYVQSLDINKSQIADGRIRVNANIRSIYEKNGSAPDVIMRVAVYKNGKMIANVLSDAAEALPRKSTASISAEIISGELDENCTISVFFVSGADKLRPLCTVLHENK